MVVITFDESNHGRTPETIVGVKCFGFQDVKRSNEAIPKNRDSGPSLEKVLGGRRYSHILIPDYRDTYFASFELRALARAQIMMHLADGQPLDQVMFDGSMNFHELTLIGELANSLKGDFVVVPQADQFYRGVNIADRVAFLLYRYYSSTLPSDLSGREYHAFINETKTANAYVKSLLPLRVDLFESLMGREYKPLFKK